MQYLRNSNYTLNLNQVFQISIHYAKTDTGKYIMKVTPCKEAITHSKTLHFYQTSTRIKAQNTNVHGKYKPQRCYLNEFLMFI